MVLPHADRGPTTLRVVLEPEQKQPGIRLGGYPVINGGGAVFPGIRLGYNIHGGYPEIHTWRLSGNPQGGRLSYLGLD